MRVYQQNLFGNYSGEVFVIYVKGRRVARNMNMPYNKYYANVA